MANLTNANLLDENVGINLKKERLQKTEQTALNPEIVQQQRPKPQPQQQNTQVAEATKNNDEQIPNNLPVKNYAKKESAKDSNDNKILGMKPALFYTLLGVVVIAGGYYTYKKFGKKLKIGGGSGLGNDTKNILNKDIPIT